MISIKRAASFAIILCSIPSLTSYSNDRKVAAKGEDATRLDNSIHVGSPGMKRFKISIPYFSTEKNSDTSQKISSETTKRMRNILDFTNWFEFSADDNSPEYLLKGKISDVNRRGKFDLELQFQNLKSKNMLMQRSYKDLDDSSYDLALRKFGDELIQVLTGTPGPFMSRIAFVGRNKENSDQSQIYIADFDGSHAIEITDSKTINTSPSWSPDGNKITYTSYGTGYAEIYQYDLRTEKTTRMTTYMGSTSGSAWSADGREIAFSSHIAGKTQIFVMNSAGGAKRKMICENDIEVEPAFSPDGNYLAYTSNKFSKPMLFLRNLRSNGQDKRLTFAGWYNASPSWSPDSKSIAFASYDKEIDRWDLFKINANGENLERVTLKQGDNEKPTWSPDGRFIMFQSTRGPSNADVIKQPHQLFIMSKEGDMQKMIHVPVYDARLPTWGPRIRD